MVRPAQQRRRTRYRLAALLLVAPASVALAAEDGSTLYTRYCAQCHEVGAGRAPTRDVLAQRPKAEILRSLEGGVMREQGEKRTPEERELLAAFLVGENPAAAGAAEGGAAAAAPAGAPAAGPAAAQNARRPAPAELGPPPKNLCTFRPYIDLDEPHYNGWGVSITNERSISAKDAGLAAADVPKLRLKWAFGFPGAIAAAVQPTVVGRWVFVGSTSGRLYALDLNLGCVFWTFDAAQTVRSAVTIVPISRIENGGARHQAIFSDRSGTVYSLNPMTGELRWKRQVGGGRAGGSGSPQVYNGRIYVPLTGAGGESEDSRSLSHGAVVALDAETGAQLWESSTLLSPPQPGRGPNGVGVWNTPTIDTKLGRLYVGTGDSHASPAGPTSDSIVSYDLKTGAMGWIFQATQGDAYVNNCDKPLMKDCPSENGPDIDFAQPPALVTLENGKRVLVAGQKNGMVYALDPDNKGKELWRARAGKGSALGGIMWGLASDGKNAYVAVGDDLDSVDRYLTNPDGGALVAYRLSDGKELWRTKGLSGCAEHEGSIQRRNPSPVNVTERAPPYFGCSNGQNAPVTLIPGVAFSGALDGHLRAYDTADGKVLWDFDTARSFYTVNFVDARGGSIDSGGVAVVNGTVLTTSGYSSWGGIHGNVLLAFSVEDAP